MGEEQDGEKDDVMCADQINLVFSGCPSFQVCLFVCDVLFCFLFIYFFFIPALLFSPES